MAAWRRAIELSLGEADTAKLRSIAQSRTEPASRVERARILLAYREDPSFFAVGRALGLHHQTVQRCVERAVAEGPLAALDDRARPGREPTITPEAKAWLVSLACRKAKELGYPHELWTTRLLARHAREHGPAEGHACLANLAQGTVCKILDQEEVKPHKVRYYLEQRDPDFAEKMAEVLCVYRQVRILKQAAAVSKKKLSDAMAIISYDEKPGIQAIATTAPDLPPEPGVHATFAREHEYKRHGTISLLAGIDLVTGKVHALVKDRHPSREFLLYVVDIGDPHVAIGTSALSVAANAFANLLGHWRAGNVKWPCAATFALAGVVGAAIGSTLGKLVDGQQLLFLFALAMIAVGAAMLRPRAAAGNPDVRMTTGIAVRLIAIGLVVGAVSGFFGIGGGFLIVPGLMLASGMPILNAIGSSLFSVGSFGLTTAINYALSGLIEWAIALLFIAGGVAGGYLGMHAAMSLAANRRRLTSVFAGIIFAVAIYMLARTGIPPWLSI